MTLPIAKGLRPAGRIGEQRQSPASDHDTTQRVHNTRSVLADRRRDASNGRLAAERQIDGPLLTENGRHAACFVSKFPRQDRNPFWPPEPGRPFNPITIILSALLVAAIAAAAVGAIILAAA